MASAVLWSVGAVTLTYAVFCVAVNWKYFQANYALGYAAFLRILVMPAFWLVSAVLLFAVMIWKLK
jgi:hypothetical protein